MESNHQEVELQTRKDIEARIIAKAWKDEAYKHELLTNPKVVIEREFGMEIPEEVSIQVTEENPTSLYLVIPISPEIEGVELSEEELEVLAGGNRFKRFLGKKVFPAGKIKRKGVGKSIAATVATVGGSVAAAGGFFATQDIQRRYNI